jgi:hypothetical protein
MKSRYVVALFELFPAVEFKWLERTLYSDYIAFIRETNISAFFTVTSAPYLGTSDYQFPSPLSQYLCQYMLEGRSSSRY